MRLLLKLSLETKIDVPEIHNAVSYLFDTAFII